MAGVLPECAHISSLVRLKNPCTSVDNNQNLFFDALVPCYHNPGISPIVCSMHVTTTDGGEILPGTFSLLATEGFFI
jgi:hypothetical protein